MSRSRETNARQIRGSTLLLAGSVLTRLLNGTTQILLARSLSKASYGAFAYGIAATGIVEVIVTLGLIQAVTRYVPVYEERGEHGKAIGTLALIFGTIISLGIVAITVVSIYSGEIERVLIHDRLTAAVFAILIFLVPIEALNRMAEGVLAVLGRPGLIFVRKNLVGPGLRLAVIAMLVVRGSGPQAMATAYVILGAIGLAIYSGILTRAFRDHGFPLRDAWRRLEVPFREVGAYVLPLLVTGLVWVIVEAGDAIALGRFATPAQVAELRAVLPLALLMQAVRFSFIPMFTAFAARLFVREDRAGLNDAYWRTITWVALLTFPLFAVESVFARTLTSTIFGARYASSASVLTILAVAYFVQAVWSTSGNLLSVMGRVKYLMFAHLVVLAAFAGVAVLLTPRWGADGAALAKLSAIAVSCVLSQLGLRGTGVRLFEVRMAPVYLSMAAGVAALWVVERIVGPPLWMALVLTGVVWLALVAGTRRALAISEIFPEIRDIPLARYLAVDPDDS